MAPKTAILPFSVVGLRRNRLRTQYELAKLTVVDNPRFAVAILILSVIVLEILALPCWRSYCHFRLSVSVAFICEHFFELAVVENFAFTTRINYDTGT